MSRQPKYKRVVVKLSGESLCVPGGRGLDAEALATVADELAGLAEMRVQAAVVVGAGNQLRGRDLADNPHIHRATADAMGMLATVMNALALRDTLQGRSLPACVMVAEGISGICETFDRLSAIAHLEAGRFVIFAGGTGSPFLTTDTCAALRALEIDADVLLKATKVDGVYDSDPVQNPKAKRYDHLSYEKALADKLGVMDLTAFSMCMENSLPVVVFKLSQSCALAAVAAGEDVGTTLS